ncbi:MAG: hypothetical protein HDQ88_10515 [Clostridia bacterium]|nr:hypothetical protein [Clostridia bacterium]
MDKPRVLFPFTEAGLGHIMPMNSIADEFEKRYGDKVECVRSNFFADSGNKNLKIFEDRLASEVVHHNKHTAYGFFATFNMEFWGVRLSTWGTMKFLKLGSRKPGYKYMDELKPDLVVSTHWATNYYAKKCKCKPLTVMYCPDAHVNPLFRYPCDIAMVSNRAGYDTAIKRHPRRLNKENFKLVPFLIREEAFTIHATKQEARAKLGFDENKFTIVLAEGGYGIGKMTDICKLIIERDLPVNVVAVCGRNEELYKEFLTVKTKGNTNFYPMGLIDNMFEVLSCADLFCGKSGASMSAEPCFFGVPQIITKYATNIERYIGKYYVEIVGSALKIFKPEKVVDKIEEFLREPEKLEPFRQNALAQHKNYGAEECAKIIFDLLCTKFPHLKE